QVMRPAVNEDAAATLGAVCDAQPVDARGVAHVVAWERIGLIRATDMAERIVVVRGVAIRKGHRAREQGGSGRESAQFATSSATRVQRRGEVDSLTQYGDSRTFEGSHESWLLQQLGQVSILSGVPPDNGFE